jgi:hypothetical protein
MSDETAGERITAIWSPEARADLRALDRKLAMQILRCIDRFLASRAGDLKKLKPLERGFASAVATTAFSSIRTEELDRNHRCSKPPRSLPLKEHARTRA